MFEVDNYLSKQFVAGKYECWDMAKEVWKDITGQDIQQCRPIGYTRESVWMHVTSQQPHFKELASPESPCLVLMQRANDVPHIGVFFEGRVLHLRRNGAAYQSLDIARVGFPVVLFYTTK